MPQLLGLSWCWHCSDVAERVREWIIRCCSRITDPQRSAQPLLCVAWMAQPLFLASAPHHPPHCMATAGATGALEIRSVQVLTWQLEVGEEFQPWEKVEEAAAEPGGAAGSAGSARPPGRGLWLCLLRGELGGKGTPALQTRCALRFHWFLVQKFRAWWHYELVFFSPLLLRKMKIFLSETQDIPGCTV